MSGATRRGAEPAQLEEARQVDDDVQHAIVGDVVAVLLPLIAALAVLVLAMFIATSQVAVQPLRIVTPFITLALVAGAKLALWRRRRRLAVGLLVAALAGASGYGMIVNGGLRAPAAPVLLVAVAIVGWLFGRRVARPFALAAAATYLVVGALSYEHLLREPPPPVPINHGVVMAICVWVLWSATSTPRARMRGALLDVLVRERELYAEQERRAASDLAFKAVLDRIAHMLMLVRPDGALVSANRAALELLGLNDDAIVGQPLVDLPVWPAAAREELRAALAQKRVAPFEVRTEGGRRVLQLSVTPFWDGGALRYVIVEGQDVSELLEGRERQAQGQRLQLVGQLAGGVAHDFNNVLTGILTSGELLQADLAGSPALTADVKESVDTIVTMAQRASDLTRRLLTFGRRATLARKPMSMHDLIGSTVKLLERTLPPNVQVRTELLAPTDVVGGDVASVESVLLNLAVNARDAMPSGGVLTLRTECVELDEEWCATSGREIEPGAYLRVSVSDTGTGVAPELLGRVFEPFFTTKPEGHGTGIGLASVLASMRDHGGTVHVYSEVGRGTLFQLHFPLAIGAPAAVAPISPDYDFTGARALLVDDEPALRQRGARLLQHLGVACVAAPDAESALVEFRKEPTGFDFAVIDVVLPGRMGDELAMELLAASSTLRVLLVSGFARDADLERLPPGRVALLAKPYTVAAIRAALARLLGAPPIAKTG
jgi:PAS domain S-box-containing protein